jgi:c-di-GMP-binding flagellar brake protein YcgR
MDRNLNKAGTRSLVVRDRRYAIRHPFAADAECLDLEAGAAATGVTSDVSMGGCFVCTSKPLSVGSRIRLKLRRKDQTVEALAAVRIVRPKVGMGIEFLDLEERDQRTLARWLDEVRGNR